MIKEKLFIIQLGSKRRFWEYVTDDEEVDMFAAQIIDGKRNRSSLKTLF